MWGDPCPTVGVEAWEEPEEDVDRLEEVRVMGGGAEAVGSSLGGVRPSRMAIMLWRHESNAHTQACTHAHSHSHMVHNRLTDNKELPTCVSL